jgi:peptidyl-prolyl cis-trans isomerase D
MFDFVRKHNRVMQVLLFLLIVPSFVLFGLEGYNRFQEKGETVARVDGLNITQGEWDEAHKREVDRLRQQMPNLDAKLLDSPQARYGTLERLVHNYVVAAAAHKSNLVATDQRLARELQKDETIATLRAPDGRLDMERYRQLLVAQGMTPEMFENRVRADIVARQVLAGIGMTSFATPTQADVSLAATREKREAQVARFNTTDYAARITPTDAELEAFYKARPQMFQAPEQATVEYLVLDLDALGKSVTVNEQDLKTYYEQNVARLAAKEERRASHILIAVPKGAPAAEREKAKAKADELLAAVRKNPDSFAEVAKKNSQDPGSAAQGGDLDFFGRGAMTKPFEDTAFALKKGDISNVLETEFGYHIIRLTDIRTPQQRTYEQVRPELEAELRKQQAQRKFAEAAETFTNTVYEQADSLKPAAEKLKLEVRTAKGVTRQPAPGATGPLAHPKLLAALFSPDSVSKKRNTEAVEVGTSQLAAGRLAQYEPARTRPFAEVKEEVRAQLLAERGAELAKKEGQAKLAAWKAEPAGAALAPAAVFSRDDIGKQPRALVEAVLRADPTALPAFVGVDLGPAGYAVARVVKVLPPDAAAADAQVQQARQQYNRSWATAENMAYYKLLQSRFKAEIVVPKPADTELQ